MNRNIAKDVINWIADNLSGLTNLLVLLCTFILSVLLELKPDIPSLNFEQYKWWLCGFVGFIIIAISFVSFLKDATRNKRITLLDNRISVLESEKAKLSDEKGNLESQIEKLMNDTKEIFDSYLGFMSKSLQLSHKHRISVYKYSFEKFVIIR